jgi:hypothetical protein
MIAKMCLAEQYFIILIAYFTLGNPSGVVFLIKAVGGRRANKLAAFWSLRAILQQRAFKWISRESFFTG